MAIANATGRAIALVCGLSIVMATGCKKSDPPASEQAPPALSGPATPAAIGSAALLSSARPSAAPLPQQALPSSLTPTPAGSVTNPAVLAELGRLVGSAPGVNSIVDDSDAKGKAAADRAMRAWNQVVPNIATKALDPLAESGPITDCKTAMTDSGWQAGGCHVKVTVKRVREGSQIRMRCLDATGTVLPVEVARGAWLPETTKPGDRIRWDLDSHADAVVSCVGAGGSQMELSLVVDDSPEAKERRAQNVAEAKEERARKVAEEKEERERKVTEEKEERQRKAAEQKEERERKVAAEKEEREQKVAAEKEERERKAAERAEKAKESAGPSCRAYVACLCGLVAASASSAGANPSLNKAQCAAAEQLLSRGLEDPCKAALDAFKQAFTAETRAAYSALGISVPSECF